MKADYRPSTPADSAAIRKLLCDVFEMDAAHPTAEEHHVDWKYWQKREDWPEPRSFVLTKDGELVAHGAIVPGWCRWKDHRVTVSHLIDWAALPAAVGAGVNVLKRTAKLTEAHVVAGGSDATRKILPLFGYRQTGVITRHVRPIRPLRRLLDDRHKSSRLLAQFARSAVWSARAPGVDTAGFSVRRLRSDEVEAAALPFPDTSHGSLIFERSAALLRYQLDSPPARVSLHALEKDGRAHGYFLLASVPGQVRIIDCWMASPHAAHWKALTQLAVATARSLDRKAAEVVIACSDPELEPVLAACGFHPRGDAPIFFHTSSGIPFPEVPIRFHMIDGDLACRHEGVVDFWA